MKSSFSLKSKLFITFLSFFTFILIVDFYITFKKTKDDASSYLLTYNKSISSILSKQLVNDLYEYNYSEIKNIIDVYSSDLIENVIVLTKDGYIFAQQHTNFIELSKIDDFEKIKSVKNENIFMHKSEIKLLDDVIGYLIIKNKKETFIEKEKKDIFNLQVMFVKMFLISLFAAFVFGRIIIDPIEEIIKSIQNKQSDENLNIAYKKDDELGYLANVIEDRHNQVSLLNKELNGKIKSLTEMNQTIKKQNKEIKEQQYFLTEQSKMAAMGEMIGNIAHQWRQPLSAISTQATGLIVQNKLGLLDDSEIEEACDRINKNSKHMSQTIDVFQNFIKGQRVKKSININDLILDFHELIEGIKIESRVEIILDIDKDININCVSNELIQCFMNIFQNSNDAFISNNIEKKLFFIKAQYKDDKIVIILTDNAGGMEKNILKKVFDPYFTTKHQSQGTGLGLYMTYKIITEGMNGNIFVKNMKYTHDNSTFCGASFEMYFPKG